MQSCHYVYCYCKILSDTPEDLAELHCIIPTGAAGNIVCCYILLSLLNLNERHQVCWHEAWDCILPLH